MKRLMTTLAAAALATGTLAACGSDDESSAAESVSGTTGSVSATPGAEVSDTPEITIDDAPLSVGETTVQVINEGDGDVVPEGATVSVWYHGVSGVNGEMFDSSYDDGAPVTFPLTGVVPGFSKAIAGQKVGSDILVAVAPEDGYGPSGGIPAKGIGADDTLVFFIHIDEIVE